MNKVQQSIVLLGITITITSMLMIIAGNYAFAVEYTNYTSEKYGIQFEYPNDWKVTEKSSRFDQSGDLTIRSGKLGGEVFNIDYFDDLISGFRSSNLEKATANFLSDITIYPDTRLIEAPHFITIDNHKAGTLVTIMEDIYGELPSLASQNWIVFVGDYGYLVSYVESPNTFDNPENIMIREHFINSIKFLGDTEPQQKSRFD